MLADRIIEKYVDEAAKSSPLMTRAAVRSGLKDMIYEMLTSYCEGDRPTLRDAREVLRAIGSPEDAALQYRRQMGLEVKKSRKKALRVLKHVQELAFAIATLLMISGLMSVVIGKAGNIKAFLAGAVIAVTIVAVRNFIPINDAADDEETQTFPAGL